MAAKSAVRTRQTTGKRARAASRSRATARVVRPTATDDPQGRLTRKAWIEGAIQKLAGDSVAALRVDELADDLNVTKGSFYWHFKSREDLLAAVLDHWHALMTQEIEALIIAHPGDPVERMRKLLRIAIAPRPDVPGGPFELTLRDWARRDPAVAQVVQEVDEARARFLARLYRDAGFDADTAQDYAIAQMAFIIGGRTAFSEDGPAAFSRRRRIAETLFLPKRPRDTDREASR